MLWLTGPRAPPASGGGLDMLLGVDLFAGAGGMSLGARNAGIDVVAAVEIRASACKTYALNHPSTDMIQKDIRQIPTLDVRPGSAEIVLFGGPPCQGFSTSNQRTRDQGNASNWLFTELLRIVEAIGPQWVVIENVAGILQTVGGMFAKAYREGLSRLGYHLSEGVLDAADFGVPQRRGRFFMIGARDRHPVDLPVPRKVNLVTVADAVSDLPTLQNGASIDELDYGAAACSEYSRELRGAFARCTGHLVTRNADHIVSRYHHIPQGGNWRNIPEALMDSYTDRTRCHTGIYRRLVASERSVVIGNFRKNMLIHPTQDRGLSVREAARLQSFPDGYRFTGTIGLQQQQVGNAVPPRLAQAVFEQIHSVAEARKMVVNAN
jgi:DNA (cytosine-5)-methyltransferase 1